MTKFEEKDINSLFQQAKKDFKPEVNPFLKTRILAEVEGKNEKSLKNILLKPWMMFLQGGVVAILLVLSVNQIQKDQVEAFVGQAYAINIELEKINDRSVAFIKVNLPSDVIFYSKTRNGSLSRKRSLLLPMETIAAFEKLPIVIKSKGVGSKKIKLTLLDQQKNKIKEKQIKMKFTHSQELVF